MTDFDTISHTERSPATDATIRRYTSGRWEVVDGAVVRETPVTIYVNRQELVTVQCTPLRVNHLTLGFLYNEGLISSLDDVEMMRVCDEDSTVDVRLSQDKPVAWHRRTLTSGCGAVFSIADQMRDLSPVQSSLSVTALQLLGLAKQLQAAATIFRQYGGVHAAALADAERLLAVAEDVARHNTIDKLCGQSLLDPISTDDKIIITTGRLSSEIVLKAARMRVSLLVSRNSPTARAVALGDALGITLVGYARGASLNVYTHIGRVAGAES